jgi:polyhydroxyalkanoate synthesis regulator phasin
LPLLLDISNALRYITTYNAVRYFVLVCDQAGDKTMNTTIAQTDEKNYFVVDLARKALHIGLGTVILVQEEVSTAAEKAQSQLTHLVEKTQQEATHWLSNFEEKGAKAEQTGLEKVNDFWKNNSAQLLKPAGSQAKPVPSEYIASVLHSLNVPTKTDLEELNEKLAYLTRQVNALAKPAKKSKTAG